MRTDIKIELMRRNKKQRDLARALGYDYVQLSKIITGLAHEPADFEQKIRHIFKLWDAEQRPSAIVPPLSDGSAGRLIRNMTRPMG